MTSLGNFSIWVRIQELEGASSPNPKPLLSGFSLEREYLIYGVADYSETSEGYFMLVNDRNEFWWISNRHVRFSRSESHVPNIPVCSVKDAFLP